MNTPTLLSSLFILILGNQLFGQNQQITGENDLAFPKSIYFDSETRYSSSFLPVTDFLSIALNPLITDEFIDDLYKKSSMHNKILYFDKQSVFFQMPVNETTGWIFGVNTTNFFHLRFDGDLLGLMSNGNTAFKGQTLNVNNSSLTFFQQSGLSISYRKLLLFKGLKFLVKPSVNLNQSKNFAKMSLVNSSLFTEENGEFISLDYDYSYAIQTVSSSFSGLGASMDLLLKLYSKTGKSTAEIGFKNLGFIKHNNNDFRAASQSGSITYSGRFLLYEQLTNLGGNNIKNETDSLVELIAPNNVKNSSTTNYPVTFVLNFSSILGEKDFFKFNTYYIRNYTYEPVFNLSYSRLFSEKLNAGFNIGNGAFGGLSIGLNSEFWIRKINVGIDIKGLFQLSKGVNAQSGALLSLGYFFK